MIIVLECLKCCHMLEHSFCVTQKTLLKSVSESSKEVEIKSLDEKYLK